MILTLDAEAVDVFTPIRGISRIQPHLPPATWSLQESPYSGVRLVVGSTRTPVTPASARGALLFVVPLSSGSVGDALAWSVFHDIRRITGDLFNGT